MKANPFACATPGCPNDNRGVGFNYCNSCLGDPPFGVHSALPDATIKEIKAGTWPTVSIDHPIRGVLLCRLATEVLTLREAKNSAIIDLQAAILERDRILDDLKKLQDGKAKVGIPTKEKAAAGHDPDHPMCMCHECTNEPEDFYAYSPDEPWPLTMPAVFEAIAEVFEKYTSKQISGSAVKVSELVFALREAARKR